MYPTTLVFTNTYYDLKSGSTSLRRCLLGTPLLGIPLHSWNPFTLGNNKQKVIINKQDVTE